MSSTRIGEKDRLYMYINHKRFDWSTIRLEIFEKDDAIDATFIPTDMDDFLNLFEEFAGEVKLKLEAKKLTTKIKTKMLKKYDDWPQSTTAPDR